ncbi:MAG: glycoside hydrolase, partial [Clostridiaceae bacterium]|nr:glycoside hydrolase [Clostridiaceae bacterium]
VYEEHYRRYSLEFGNTIEGFFTDEHRFGNVSSYEATLGKVQMVLPFSNSLLKHLSDSWGEDFRPYLPCLWYDAGTITSKIRFTYMDVVSKLYSQNYTNQIGNWCREHNVKFIGHVIEDNGAHARLGYGSGHFFRSLKGQDYSGYDVVYQIWPGRSSGKFTTALGYLDADFFYWGISKMASSDGHIDPCKNGITFCEIFGAYGWQEGLKLMKWLTDHVCVRGANFIIPHAFSPKYPDPDCPPHFYARGANPQWRYFHIWAQYTNRLCHLLTGGKHIAPVAILYHAEAEWAGDYEPFEKVVKVLTQFQVDCDVVPIDTFMEGEPLVRIESESIIINKEKYGALIIPYAQYLPYMFINQIIEFAEKGVKIIFMRQFPQGSSTKSYSFSNILEELRSSKNIFCCSYDELIENLKYYNIYDIETTSFEKDLRSFHYQHEDGTIYFFTNESLTTSIDTVVTFPFESQPYAYDAMEGKCYKLNYENRNECTNVELFLEPYESIFIIFSNSIPENLPFKPLAKNMKTVAVLDGEWKISIADINEYPNFRLQPHIKSLGNLARPGFLPNFSGVIRYEKEFIVEELDFHNGRILLDFGELYESLEVWLNEKQVRVKICPPYRLDVTKIIQIGINKLIVEVTNTLSKKLGNNVFDRAMPQEPSGLIGPVRLQLITD